MGEGLVGRGYASGIGKGMVSRCSFELSVALSCFERDVFPSDACYISI